MNIFLRAVFLISFLFTSSSAEKYIVSNVKSNDTLNIREYPDYSAKKVGELAYNALVDVYQCSNDKKWCKATWTAPGQDESLEGHIVARYLKKLSDRDAEVVRKKQNLYENKIYKVDKHGPGEYLNVRLGRGTAYAVIDKLPYNKMNIEIIACLEGWCWISYHEYYNSYKEGWVHQKYLSETKKSIKPFDLEALGIVDYTSLNEKELMKPYLSTFDSAISSAMGKNTTILLGLKDEDKYLLTVSEYNHSIKVWDFKTKRLIRVMERDYSKVDANDDPLLVVLSPDGKYLFEYANKKSVDVLNLETGKQVHSFKWENNQDISENDGFLKNGWAYTKDKKYVMSFNPQQTMLQIYNAETFEIIHELKTFDTFIETADGEFTVSIADNLGISGLGFDYLNFLSVKNNNEKTVYKFFKDYFDGFSLFEKLSDTKNLTRKFELFDDNDGNLFLKEKRTGKVKYRYDREPLDGIPYYEFSETYTFSKDQRYMIMDMEKYDLVTGNKIMEFGGEEDYANTVNISLDEHYLVTTFSLSSLEGCRTLTLYDYTTGKKLKQLKYDGNIEERGDSDCYRDYETAATFSSDNTTLALGTRGGTILLWNIDTGKVKELARKYEGSITSLSLTSENKYLLSTQGNTVKLRDVKSAKVLKVFKHSAEVTKAIFVNGEKQILSTSFDGMTKLWDVESGKELLSMVSFKDGEWIAITPEGYFNASENGAKYLNILTGPMSVTSVDAYYETFYRPDIVKAALEGNKIDTGLAMSDIKPAPEVEIVGVPKNIKSDEVEITLKIKDNGGGVGDIRLYLNDVAVKTDSRAIVRKQSKDTLHKNYRLKLPNGKHTIKAIVFNETNTMQSNDATHTINVKYKITHKPELHALVIGIDTFKNPKLKLKYAVNDARLFADTIKSQSKGLFSKTVIHKLDTKENTTKEAITEKLKALQTLNPNDLFVFYVASHGTVDEGEYFLFTSNVGYTSTHKLKLDALQQTELKRLIANVPTTKKLIVLDTCYSGSMAKALSTRGMSEDRAMKILSRAVGSTILSAASSEEQALEGYKDHGLFTYVLTEGLKGKADSNNDGYVKTLELVTYLEDEVPQLAEELFNHAQYPTLLPDGRAFPIGKVK